MYLLCFLCSCSSSYIHPRRQIPVVHCHRFTGDKARVYPAVFTRTSTRANLCKTASRKASIRGPRTEIGRMTNRRSVLELRFRGKLPQDDQRAGRSGITFAPCSANPRASALPIPDVPPITPVTRSEISGSFIIFNKASKRYGYHRDRPNDRLE